MFKWIIAINRPSLLKNSTVDRDEEHGQGLSTEGLCLGW